MMPLTTPAENPTTSKNCPICACYFDTGTVRCMIHKPHETWRSSGGQPDHEQPQSETSYQDGETGSPAGPPVETTANSVGTWKYPEPVQNLAFLDPPIVKDHSPVKTYDVRECQLILHLSKGKTLQFIRNYILPIPGAVALVGRKYLVHQWALNHALQLRSVSPRPLNLEQSSRARKHLKRRGQSPLTSSETPSSSSGEKS